MKTRPTALRSCAALALALVTLTSAAQASAQAPTVMPIQGFLTDAGGAPLAGEFALTVALYTTEVGGDPRYLETQSVLIEAGFFTVYVGDGEPLDLTLFRDESALWVGIAVAEDAEMAPRLALGTVPFAAYAEHAGSVRYDDVSGVPAGLADGDDDTTYAAGDGITLAAGTFAADRTVMQARVAGACAAGQSIRAIAADGTVTCEVDDGGASYSAGAGLALAGTTFSVDLATVQRRVSGSCPLGQSIRAIGADGSVACELDDDTMPTAGAGLIASGTTFSVDTSLIQARVSGSCPAGQSIRSIGAGGTVVCEIDDSASYTSGFGLVLSGTTFGVDTSAIQARIAGSCPVGQSIRAIGVGGTVTCEPTALTPEVECAAGVSMGGVCVRSWDNIPRTDFLLAAATCAAAGSDLCSASQYAVLTSGRGTEVGFDLFLGDGVPVALWSRNGSDNDGMRIGWLRSDDNPPISRSYGYACCDRVTPPSYQARGTLVPAMGSARGVLTTFVQPAESAPYATAAQICAGLRSDLCSAAQYVILNDAGRFGSTARRATSDVSGNDGGNWSSVVGARTADDASPNARWAFACCASQRPADGSCPGTVVRGVCTVDVHEAPDRTFVQAARACGALGADICSNSQMSRLRADGRFSGAGSWTNEGADNDGGSVGGLLSTQPDNPHPTTTLMAYACCL
ncbi:MAG: hypothetical protein M3Y87_31640 [Myxococcota bacterium]|nr:hypothetical protein [Myxococcota bacterium]